MQKFLPKAWARVAWRWETLLLALLLAVILINSWLSPHFLDFYNLSDSTFNFSEKALIALPMALLIICRQIDLSVASTIALASTMIGVVHGMDAPVPVLLATGALVGLAAGLLNGFLITWFNVPSIVVTIGTLSLFRGISYVIIGDQVLTGYSRDFARLGQGYFLHVPIEFWVLLGFTAIFAFVVHFTLIGRNIFAIGLNPNAAFYSGVPVDRYRLILFALTGCMAGLAAVFLTSRIGSTRPNIASGWELDVITMVVLGGVRIEGGKGTILGVFLAVLLLGMINFGLQLVNIPGIVLGVFVGLLLVMAIAAPRLGELIASRRHAERPQDNL